MLFDKALGLVLFPFFFFFPHGAVFFTPGEQLKIPPLRLTNTELKLPARSFLLYIRGQ